MMNLKQKFIKWGQNFKININTDNKKKTIIAIISILLVFTIVIGMSYALEIFQDISGDNVIKSGKVAMSYTESSNVINITNALPMTDEVGKQQTNYFDFSISSKADTNADDNEGIKIPYDLIIEPKTIDSDKDALTNEQIKVYLTKIENGTETIVLEPTKISELTAAETNFNLYSTENIHKNGNGMITTKYRLRAWIDYGVDVSEWKETAKQKQYKFAVNVNGTGAGITKTDPNPPLLTSNMIPVYYDESNDTWKKADVTNKNKKNQWYDYDKKKWANAVTVYDNSYEEKISDDKTVSISNAQIAVDTYTSSVDYYTNHEEETSTMTFNFKTGSTGGYYSFEYMTSMDAYIEYTITLNGNQLINSHDYTDSYQKYAGTLEKNTYYELEVKVESMSEGGEFTISNIVLPDNLATGLRYTGDSHCTEGTRYIYPYKVYNAYHFNSVTGTYDLTAIDEEVTKFSNDTIGKYVCSDLRSTTCNKIYEITEINGEIATKARVHEAGEITKRDYYLNAPVGTPIKMGNINAMFVWIPRYKYTYFASSEPTEIQINFEKGTESTGTISCADAIAANSGKSENCTDTINGSITKGVSTYTHPAFTFGNEKLTGIWVGKFENSATTFSVGEPTKLREVLIKPDVQSWSNTYLSAFTNSIRNMELANNIYGFPQTGTTLNTYTGEIAGDSNNFDIHNMKNMEWGAAAYLSHSKYGKNSEIFINNSADKYGRISYTGRSGGNVGGSTLINETYPDQTEKGSRTDTGYYTYDGYLLKYNTNIRSTTRDLSKVSSTTGNIYGIYDMSGGRNEEVMGNEQDSSNAFYPRASETWDTTNKPLDKYYDKYSYGTSYTEYTRGKLGDATIEMQPNGTSKTTWYSDYAIFVSDNPWFRRGGYDSSTVNNGIFTFEAGVGFNTYDHGSRTVLTISN